MDERHSTADSLPENATGAGRNSSAAPSSLDEPDGSGPGLRDRPGIRDALYAFFFMFPAAALVALVYRFPLPLGGTVSGPAGAWNAMLATLFYGLVGGFVVVPGLAAALGALLRKRGIESPALVTVPSVSAALLYAVVLAALA